MGNCFLHLCPPQKEDQRESNALTMLKDSRANDYGSSVRQNMIFSASFRGDVSKYYEIVRVLGEGSMGSVSLVRKKNEFVGGSAYTSRRKGFFGRVIEERKKAPLEVIGESNSKHYALKSIILSRVSVSFVTHYCFMYFLPAIMKSDTLPMTCSYLGNLSTMWSFTG